MDSLQGRGKTTFRRSEAIQIMSDMQNDSETDPEDQVDFSEMTNEELEAELCLSGYIHDEFMGGVIDD